MMLSKYFSYAEAVRSEIAEEMKIENKPSKDHLMNLIALFKNTGDPIRELFGVPITPSSAYRCPKVNVLAGSTNRSQHPKGEAFDFSIPGYTPRQVIKRILDAGIPFDQIIDEYEGWVHVSFSRLKNRGQILEYRKKYGKTVWRALSRSYFQDIA